MKQIHYPRWMLSRTFCIYFTVYFADCNESENVFSFSKTDSNSKTRPVIVYNKNLCKIRATSAEKKKTQQKTVFSTATVLVVVHSSISSLYGNQEDSCGPIVNNGIVIHHLIMIWQMHAPSPFSASSSLSILRSAKLSRTPPVGLIRAVCLCEAAGALGAAGARHCQWTERLTLPGSCTQTHASRSLVIVFTLTLSCSLPCLPGSVRAPSSSPSYACVFPFPPCLSLPLSSLSFALRPPSLSSRQNQEHTKELVEGAPVGGQCSRTSVVVGKKS